MGQLASTEARLEEIDQRLLPAARQRMLALGPEAGAEKAAGVPPAPGSKQAQLQVALCYVDQLRMEAAALTDRKSECHNAIYSTLFLSELASLSRLRVNPIAAVPTQALARRGESLPLPAVQCRLHVALFLRALVLCWACTGSCPPVASARLPCSCSERVAAV